MISKKSNNGLPKAGRPSLYKPEYAELAKNYCLLGADDSQLAEFLGIRRSTLNNWKKAHPEFFEAISLGKVYADSQVAHSLYQSALGGHFVLEEKAISDGQGGFQIVMLKRQLPPNVTSQIFWLKNRQPKHWKDRVEVVAELKGDPFPPKAVLDAMYAKSLARSAEEAKKLVGRRERLGIVVNTKPDND